jgi:hypothetical protein
MASETVTVVLDGDPTLAEFRTALDALQEMLNGLAENDQESNIVWTVDALERSSALATFRGEATSPTIVYGLTSRYLETGRRIASGEPVPAGVERAASKFRGIINGRVPAVRLETADDDVTISQASPERESKSAAPPIPPTFGAVEGRVQTLSNRGSLHFTLFDLLRDKAVSCYLQEGQQDIMRNAWDKFAIVEGIVKRDETGRPQTVRQVQRVTLIDEGERGGWRRAIGALKGVGPDEPAEVTIRRIRDAG